MTNFTVERTICFPNDEIGHPFRKIDTVQHGSANYFCGKEQI